MISPESRIIRPDAWVEQPWKNGRGVTAEVWRTPTGTDFDVRVSVARVTGDGPFSTFDGFDRWSCLIEGHVELGGDGAWTQVTRDGVQLRGEHALAARTRGGATLLNVLMRRGAGWEAGWGVPRAPIRFAMALDPLPELERHAAIAFAREAAFERRVAWVGRVMQRDQRV